MTTFNQILKEAKNKITGISAAPGIVIGNAYLFSKEKIDISDGKISNVDAAISDLTDAIKKSKYELEKILELAREMMGDKRAIIFEAQMMILDDPILIGTIKRRIEFEKMLPEFIVNNEISKYQELMEKSDESYMIERAHDIEDIKNRLIRNLQKKRWKSKIIKDVIVVSSTLTPADTVLFTKRKTRAFVTDHGGLTSHAAIISRSLNIPAVLGTQNATLSIKNNDKLIIDGFHGIVLINPTKKQLNFFDKKIERLVELNKGLKGFKRKPAKTTDGKEIKLFSNLDISGEIDIAITSGTAGIGLYRSEQIIDEIGDFKSEDEQTLIYTDLAERIYPKMITIRALDIGGDKFKFSNIVEPNPFLGLRGIRFLLANTILFKHQIRAILKASSNKNVKLMLPMVSCIEEIRKSIDIINECKAELKREKIKFDNNIKIGIMIEVPSSAILSKELAKEIDFMSIGTNDLIQYLVAVDRGNDLVSDLYREFHPAVIRTLSIIINNCKETKTDLSICGEMAADTLAIPLLVGLGLDSLSMSPSTILYTKKIIRSFSYVDAKKLAEDCNSLDTSEEIQKRIEKFFKINSIKRTRNLI